MTDQTLDAAEAAFQEKWAHYVSDDTAADLVHELIPEIVVEALARVTLQDVHDLTDGSVSDEFAEFLYELATHPQTMSDIREALQ